MASAETPSPATSPPTSDWGSDSSFGRIFGVLFSPKPTFESIVRRPTWILPLILLVFVGIRESSTMITPARGMARLILRQGNRKQPQGAEADGTVDA